ncbi:phosphonate metabolism protein/1,5-bisphosphokinase (PRPP-forming) PhnN [Pseudomonas sp. BP8]|uniref:phosphonate metabolism protein/1,5-bisphosphokinase (PRPP-forming) PhnN n=1 Tax=Pseudomonas sp. BP8 TaxID=2817864 RepID=UPI001AE214BF|nr:phosphonate metabolism protein/1,5-bisphosphokinase (PRPP-forming) PhnN [Pseudomonas sp. BP8]MBP2261116.1 ribose 1,5-bisphosphokinase [Pseudomonas sp. BP8]HDS1734899.1 phosphonate metabolism protein/1,5-bisphosphokinase (PRPP-forming) PhnN [Pseudomonas putida]
MQHEASGGPGTAARLIFLVGPSGSGKDSLIDAVRAKLASQGIEIARRVITRSPEAKGELAQGVTPERFEAMREAGEFAMYWRANGLAYGIPVQIDDWLQAGRHVLVNGSRGYLAEARQRYPDLLAIQLEVAPQVLRQHLLARGRETADEVEQRLQRGARLQAQADAQVHLLDNSSTLQAAASAFFALLREQGLIGPLEQSE